MITLYLQKRRSTSNITITSEFGSSTESDQCSGPVTTNATSSSSPSLSQSSSSSSLSKKRKRVNYDDDDEVKGNDESDENIRIRKKTKDSPSVSVPRTFYRRKKQNGLNLNASQVTKDVLIDSIVNYIYDNNLTSFRLSCIRRAPQLITYCEYILRHQVKLFADNHYYLLTCFKF